MIFPVDSNVTEEAKALGAKALFVNNKKKGKFLCVFNCPSCGEHVASGYGDDTDEAYVAAMKGLCEFKTNYCQCCGQLLALPVPDEYDTCEAWDEYGWAEEAAEAAR